MLKEIVGARLVDNGQNTSGGTRYANTKWGNYLYRSLGYEYLRGTLLLQTNPQCTSERGKFGILREDKEFLMHAG